MTRKHLPERILQFGIAMIAHFSPGVETKGAAFDDKQRMVNFLLKPLAFSSGCAISIALVPFYPGTNPVHVPIRLQIALAAEDAGELGQEAIFCQQAVVLVRADARVQVDMH